MIHYDIPEPALSSDFTIDDIHKIRYWNYERFKDATSQERIDYYASYTQDAIRQLGLTKIKPLDVKSPQAVRI